MNTDEGRQKYKYLNNQLRRATDKVREKWWEEQCPELEQYGKQGRMDLTHRRVAELTKQKKKKHNTQVKDRHGKCWQIVDRRGRSEMPVEKIHRGIV